MYPVLVRWRGLPVYSYPVMLYLGLVLGVVAGNVAANVARVDSGRVFIATILLMVPALAGARLLYVVAHWDIYRLQPHRIWRRSEGGAIMYGGLPASVLASLPLLHALQLPFGSFWDIATFTILVGMIFARCGCLLHGCCAGKPTAGWFALSLPNHLGVRRRRIPTQVMEVAWATVLLMGAAALWRERPFGGALFLYLLAGYGAGRFVLQFAREEQGRTGAIPQAISAALVALSLTGFLVAWMW